MTNNDILFSDDRIMGTYPEYGGRTKMLKFFKENNADIITFGANDKVSNRMNYSECLDFIQKHKDYQFYTLVYINGWSGAQVMDRGIHVCNSAYKYLAIKDNRYRVMRYDF